MEAYQEIDQRITRLVQATGFSCSAGCGSCCEKDSVEATVLECLPAARELFLMGEAAKIRDEILEREKRGDKTCVFYSPDPHVEGNGRCSMYMTRPLICRLFGFAARKNRHGEKEYVFCKKQPPADDETRLRVNVALNSGMSIPVFQDEFMRVNSIDPGRGAELITINRAFREAIEAMFWNAPPEAGIQSAS
jgi:Fe-S-cluster containining protein